jgi:cytochrome c
MASAEIPQGTERSNEGNAMRLIAPYLASAAVLLLTCNVWAQDAGTTAAGAAPAAPAMAAGDPEAGKKVFAKCMACHTADKDQNKVGPSLKGLFGRTAGTYPKYSYSKPMVEAGKAGLVWDDAHFIQYIHDPKGVVKGTKMAFAGVKDDTDVANLIAYLKQFK